MFVINSQTQESSLCIRVRK